MIYEFITMADGSETLRATTESGEFLWIPQDPANADYQAYLDRDKPKAALSTPSV